MVGLKNVALFAASIILPASITWAAPIIEVETKPIPEKYIVLLKPHADLEGHLSWAKDVHARSLSRRDTAGVHKAWSVGSKFKAYAGEFDEETLKIIQRDERNVHSIEPDKSWRLYKSNKKDNDDSNSDNTTIITQKQAPWGLGYLSHKGKTSSDYVYNSTAGTGTYAYVVDTGCWKDHVEFEGRVQLGYNAYPDSPFIDMDGHGTHVTGTLISKTYGVAKNATVICVKVFHGGGSANTIVMDGFEWAVKDIIAKKRQRNSVINMSLGCDRSEAFNAIVDAAYDQGILTVVAAGNENQPAALVSPASSARAFSVGAIDNKNTRAYFSNYGAIVDIFAPGVNIVSTYIGKKDGDNNRTMTMSGTSMASPHVAGLALYLKSLDPEKYGNSSDAHSGLRALGVPDKVWDAGEMSPNLVAYNGVQG
ncbi:subtilisin-like protein [Neurospora crassa]|uniref:Subtilisin-like proteinase Mp1 n=1 Tax=Neurospora crassa (strain ATCC 24698 / 74-OR23-1A / CBS 708.71 / DSM 1257 / FGSC 987) TaxID=367110 RepID=Q7S0X5_NEUCR|nr:subtilisin-like proteinase Mp1 [Neurospora crassa OR74A]EAA28983.1 subtilisin-like proteinase Mp1 [Neurospora crassa OR74A]KHE88080.1 subtilisin-like protein [Neurospora crassa]|eukprot:XP_958219.1 subtilisin-like proteinase Mp1 [Neurospora crassa OR74A]